jgi:hypothetical protein
MATQNDTLIIEAFQKYKITLVDKSILAINKLLLTGKQKSLNDVLKIVKDTRNKIYQASVLMQQAQRAVLFNTTYNNLDGSKPDSVQEVIDNFSKLVGKVNVSNVSRETSGSFTVKNYHYYRTEDNYEQFYNAVVVPYYLAQKNELEQKKKIANVSGDTLLDAEFANSFAHSFANTMMRPSKVLNNDLLIFEQNVEQIVSGKRGRVKYGRLPEPGACAFCITIALRKIGYGSSGRYTSSISDFTKLTAKRYLSENTDLSSDYTSADEEVDKYHNNCRCVPYCEYTDSSFSSALEEAAKQYEAFSADNNGKKLSISNFQKFLRSQK